MQSVKRITVVSLSLFLLAMIVPGGLAAASSIDKSETVAATPFRDVPKEHWAFEAIQAMQQRKVILGYEDGTFRPDELVSREQFAKVMVAALQLPLVPAPVAPSFPDVQSERWSYRYIETAKPYLTGFSDGLFRPEEPAMREDIAAALVVAKGLDRQATSDPTQLDALFTDASSISPALRPLVARAVKVKLIKGYDDGTFRAQESLTRGETATLLYRVTPGTPVVKTAPPGTGSGASGPVEAAPAPGTTPQAEAVFFKTKNFVTNLADTDSPRYVDASVALALSDQAALTTATNIEPKIRDVVLTQLRLRTVAELSGPTGQDKLAEVLYAALKEHLPEVLLKVYVTDLTVQ